MHSEESERANRMREKNFVLRAYAISLYNTSRTGSNHVCPMP